jgi:hypothetical protein
LQPYSTVNIFDTQRSVCGQRYPQTLCARALEHFLHALQKTTLVYAMPTTCHTGISDAISSSITNDYANEGCTC